MHLKNGEEFLMWQAGEEFYELLHNGGWRSDGEEHETQIDQANAIRVIKMQREHRMEI